MSNPRALSTPEHSFSGPKDAENLNQKITDVIMTQESKTPKNVTLDKLEQNNDSFADFFCLDPQLIDSIDQYLYNSNNSIDSANFNTIHTPILTPNNSNSINNNNYSINNINNINNIGNNLLNNEIEDDIIRKGSRKLFIDDILEDVKTLDSMDKNSLKNNNLDLEITSTPDDKIDDIEFNLSHSRKISKEIDSDNEITDTSNTSVTVSGTTATNNKDTTVSEDTGKGANFTLTECTTKVTEGSTNTGTVGPHTVTEEEESDEDEDYFEECIICSESMRNELKNEIGILDECFHIFCFKCIKTWADRTNLCPICRREFTYIRKINLYYIQYLIDHNKSIINNNITTNTFLSNNSSVTVLGHTATNRPEGSSSNEGTIGASTVTEGKGANSMGMECTSEKILNEIAVVTKSGESGTFTEDTTTVGASTVTEEIDIFELFKYNINSNSIGLNNSTTVTGGKKLICNRKNKISRLKKIINVNRNWYDLIPSNVIRVQKRKLKSDEDDEGCQICGNDDNWNQQLLCDICDKGYHTYCLNPPLTTIPETSWYCQLCLSNRPELCNSSVTVTGPPNSTVVPGTSNTTTTEVTNTNNNTTSTNTTITSTSINNRSSRSSRRNSMDRNSVSDLEDENMEMRLNLLSQVYRNLNKTKRTKSNNSSVTVTGTTRNRTKSTNTTSNTNNNTNSSSNKSTKSKKKSNKNQKTTKSSTSSNSLSTGTSSSSRNNINKITNVEEMYSVINNKRIDELIQESIDTIDNYLINNINNTPKSITKGKGANNTFSTLGKGANSMGTKCTTTNTSNNSTTNKDTRMNLFNTRYPNTFTTNTSTSYTNRNINSMRNSFNRNFNSLRNSNTGIRNTNSMRNNNFTNRNNNNYTNRNNNTGYTSRNTNNMSNSMNMNMNEMDDKKYTSFIYRYKTINEEYGNSTSSNIINNKNDKSEPHINGNTVKYLF